MKNRPKGIFERTRGMTKERVRDIPEKFRQPDDFTGRVVKNNKEVVSFNSTSHIRIWYNNQSEGYALHSHDAFEVCICVENTYEIHANANKIILKEGDILIIPPHILHEYINDHYGVRFIYLIEMNDFYKSHDYKTVEPLLLNMFICNSETCPDIYEAVYRHFMNMNDAYFANDNFWETTVYINMFNVFKLISRHSEYNLRNENVNLSQSINRINALLKYIDINYSEDISTEQAAEYTGFSKYHFLRLFKLQTGYTFHDYLSIKRINIAQELLISDMPITEVAFQSGFNTLPSFCRAFKKYTAYSPTEYKKLRLSTEQQVCNL